LRVVSSANQCSSGKDSALLRRLPMMFREVPTSSATCPIVPPSAQDGTIRARNDSAWEVLRRRAYPVSTERSSSDNTTGSSFGPGIPTA
jgi:hypothetical protein